MHHGSYIEELRIITSVIGSFKFLLVTRKRVPSFSSCLDKTRMIVVELRISSSSFSILSTKLTPAEEPLPGLENSTLQILRHCRLLITAPIAIPPTNTTHCPTRTRFPNQLCRPKNQEFTASAIDTAAEEAKHMNSRTDKTASKLNS